MRSTLCAVLLLALFVTTACTVGPEVAKPNWSQATSGEQYERLFWDSVKAKNWRDVEMHISGTFIFQNTEGVRSKEQTMHDYLQPMAVTDYSMGEVKTETAGADIIVTYTITLHGTFDGKPMLDQPQRMMSVWQQAKKGMIMAAHTTMPTA